MCWMVIGILLLTVKGCLSAPLNNEGEYKIFVVL
ncbi:UNVERIFIED_CONTAM: hypothetical protein NCL1_17159 [Trichonephila clavipes]